MFDFQMTEKAAKRNYVTLSQANFNLEYLLLCDSTSQLRPGSEFRLGAALVSDKCELNTTSC